MKTKFKIIVFVVSVLYCGITFGQDEFVALSSSQFLKGLDNQDFLRNTLTENGFTLVKKWKVTNFKGGIYEYWQYKSVIFVDMILRRGQQNDIIVRIYKDYPSFSQRLLESFPRKNNEIKDDYLSNIKVTHLNKDKAYSLKYSENGKNLGVYVWYDDPFFYFEYTIGQ
jgi:hypothetical protein